MSGRPDQDITSMSDRQADTSDLYVCGSCPPHDNVIADDGGLEWRQSRDDTDTETDRPLCPTHKEAMQSFDEHSRECWHPGDDY